MHDAINQIIKLAANKTIQQIIWQSLPDDMIHMIYDTYLYLSTYVVSHFKAVFDSAMMSYHLFIWSTAHIYGMTTLKITTISTRASILNMQK